MIAQYRNDAFAGWYFNLRDHLKTQRDIAIASQTLAQVPNQREARRVALRGAQYVNEHEGGLTVVGLPVFRNGRRGGALLVQADRPAEVADALDALRGERLTALAIAVVVAAIIGFLVASLITSRVKRLAGGARRIAAGDLSQPLHARGRDEIGDLGRALDSMRVALGETFEALSSERDRLSAVFVSLEDAVIVVGSDGDVRFANPAAAELITPDGQPVEALRPWLRRATHRGTVESDHVAIDEKVVGISARHLPAESAVLLVVRDRTEELRRDQAEREFVSNAAHELRNPIAGMSGAIEVLRSGAKDDPEARDHFLGRLADDVDRVARLTKSLLTLARMEAIGEGEAEVVGIGMVLDESLNTAEAPEGVSVVRRGLRRRARRGRRSRAPAAGGDRPADECVQAHDAAGHRYASRLSRRKRRDRDRGTGHGGRYPGGGTRSRLRAVLSWQWIARARRLRTRAGDRQANDRRDGWRDQRGLRRGSREHLPDQAARSRPERDPSGMRGAMKR